MEEDEDIILEGTSLHQYLQEVGFIDFEVVSSQNANNEFMKNVNELERKKTTDTQISILMKDVIHKVLGLANAEDLLLKSLGSRIISTRLLQEEDLLVLETLSPSIEHLSLYPKLIQNYKLKEGVTESIFSAEYFSPSSATFYLWCSVVVLILSLNLVGDFTLLHCLCIWGMLLFAAFYARYFYLRKYELCRNELEKTLFIIEKSNSVSKKCLKFLNELNILRKGLSQKTSLLDMSECRYENSLSEGVCSLLDTLSSVLKSSHLQLLNSKMSSSQNIHSLFSKRYDANEHAINEEDFSYSSLKTKRNVTAAQSSSFLTELFLCFELSRNSGVFRLISRSNYNLIKAKIEWLERVLRFSEKAWLNEEPFLKNIIHPRMSYEKLKMDVAGAVDVLSVRCRIVAYSGTYLKEVLVAHDLVKENKDTLYENIQKTCEDIRNELISCDACLEEVLERASNFFGRNKDVTNIASLEKSEDLTNRTETSPISEGTPIQVYGLRDRVIEDEVFEAIVDENKTKKKLGRDVAWLQCLKTEKRMKRKQKERCKRVLQEIQPILQKRREMWLDRENKALKRMELDRKGGQNKLNSELSPISNDSGLSSPSCGIDSTYQIFPSNKIIPQSSTAVQEPSKIILVPEEIKIKPTLENIRIPPTSNFANNTEYDSEEERLLLYKKVRKELDEDEAMRNDESEEDTDSDVERDSRKVLMASLKKGFQLPLPSHKGFNPAGGDTTTVGSVPFVYQDCQIEPKENSDTSSFSYSCDSNNKPGIKIEDKSFQPSQYISRIENFIESPGHASHDFVSEYHSSAHSENYVDDHIDQRFSSFSYDDLHNSSSQQRNDGAATVIAKDRQSENFSCGDTDEEDELVLDWASCGFTKNRDTLAKSIGFCGLPSVLTSEALSKRPLGGGVEEVFGGVGEGASESEKESEESSKE